jgi:hypothetical protein
LLSLNDNWRQPRLSRVWILPGTAFDFLCVLSGFVFHMPLQLSFVFILKIAKRDL